MSKTTNVKKFYFPKRPAIIYAVIFDPVGAAINKLKTCFLNVNNCFHFLSKGLYTLILKLTLSVYISQHSITGPLVLVDTGTSVFELLIYLKGKKAVPMLPFS